MALPKWTEDRADQLVGIVGDETPVSTETVANAAEQLDTTTRSVAQKLRKMGFEVQKASEAVSKWPADQEDELRNFVESNEGKYTYAEVAAQVADGQFTARQVQGKILSMELTGFIKPTEPKINIRKYTEAEEAQIVAMASDGKFLEEIAEALGREINSVRGKALSMTRSGEIAAIPPQRDKVGATAKADVLDGLVLADLTVEEIAERTEKSVRGIKSMLTRRGLSASNYDGAAKQAKRASAATE